MSFPTETAVLIVGAGPAGMAAALSMHRAGVKDVVLVEGSAFYEGGLLSRAMVIHAGTLEVRSTDI